MDFYMAVKIDDNGCFLNEPTYFDYVDAAKAHVAKQPDASAWVVYRCSEVY